MSEFTHLDHRGQVSMVDISNKASSTREAKARCQVAFPATIVEQVKTTGSHKGDLFASARIAGIMAAKKTAELIPLCHQLPLKKVTIDLHWQEDVLVITSLCKTKSDTGVEMEALTAASVAALTIYDMCKGLDKGIVISDLRLLEKSGGKSGDWQLQSSSPNAQPSSSESNLPGKDQSGSPIKIEILLFGRLSDFKHKIPATLTVPAKTRAQDLIQLLGTHDAEFAEQLSQQPIKFACNDELVGDDYTLNESDQVALLPPVTGG